MNYPEGANRNDLRCFLTVSNVLFHHLGSECIGYYIQVCQSRVGESPLLHCHCPDLGYVKQVTTCRRRSKLTTSRHCGDRTAKFLEIVRRASRNTSLPILNTKIWPGWYVSKNLES